MSDFFIDDNVRLPWQLRNRPPRDSQRKRVYASDKLYHKLDGMRIESIIGIQVWVNEAMHFLRYKEVFGPDRVLQYKRGWMDLYSSVRVHDGKNVSRATGWIDGIKMPVWSRHKLIIVHELAHTFMCRLYDYKQVASHGPEYCRTYLTLTKHCISAGVAQQLAVEFRRNGVDYETSSTLTQS